MPPEPLTVSHEFPIRGKIWGLLWELTEDRILTIRGEGEIPDNTAALWGMGSGDAGRWDPHGLCNAVILKDGITKIGAFSFYSSKIASITIPNSVTNIGKATFSGCQNLNSITLPVGLTRVEDDTFNGCTSLASVIISENITYIGRQAFECCVLKDVIIKAITPPKLDFTPGLFNFPAENDTLYVPKGCVEAYEKSGWRAVFTNIAEQQ